MQLGNKHKNLICCSIVILLSGVLAAFLADKTLPSAEGWYSYYAKCINQGQIVYKDFEYLFTPLYMYIIAAFTRVFGYSIFALRIFGILIFCGIALIIYLILSRVFSKELSVVAAVTGVYYLQSEVYTVFYDYVRVMDIFSYLSILFMVITMRQAGENKKTKYVYGWGASSALFFLVKQNMGALFLVYSCLLILFYCLIQKIKFREWLKFELKYGISVLIPILVFVFIFWKINILSDMINSIFFSAIGAKGGIATILFRWIKIGMRSFLIVAMIGVVYLGVTAVSKKLQDWSEDNIKNGEFILLIFFAACVFVGVLLICFNRQIGILYADKQRVDVTIIFIIDIVMMLFYICKLFSCRVKNGNFEIVDFLKLSLLGSYFAICYGAGMSGGLSIGESALGIALVIVMLLDGFKFRYGIILKTIGILYCINLIFGCTAFKLINPCQWWGIDESEVYSAKETVSIENLKGIKLSTETANMYQNITDIVEKNTSINDSIYCFPECPVFYVLTNRNDPGVAAKVQWFDVSDNDVVRQDIKVLENTLPKVIIIHNLYDSTYEGHESAFNNGQVSGTQEMRDALYRIIYTYSYSYAGTFVSGNDNFSVYVYREQTDLNDIFDKGIGTRENPFKIQNASDLVNLSMLSNQGYDFSGVYFEQTKIIDCADVVWVPFDYYSDFRGSYDNKGYYAYNINNSYFNSHMPFGDEFKKK